MISRPLQRLAACGLVLALCGCPRRDRADPPEPPEPPLPAQPDVETPPPPDPVPAEPDRPLPEAWPPDLRPVPEAGFPPLDQLSAGSAEAQARQRALAEAHGLPVEVETAATGIRFRLIPPGAFIMGSPASEPWRSAAEGPQTHVTLTRPLYVAVLPVTFGHRTAVLPPDHPAHARSGGGDDVPVAQVSWTEAQEFARRLGEIEGAPEGAYRLLTEAEWEYACRAGTGTPWVFGDHVNPLQANIDPDRRSHPPPPRSRARYPAGAFVANAWGLHDMHGGVWEWCADWRAEHLPGGYVTDPQGPDEGTYRVRRGGAWDAASHHARSAFRGGARPGETTGGLRIAREIPPEVLAADIPADPEPSADALEPGLHRLTAEEDPSVGYSLLLPASYGARPARRFPVVFLLHPSGQSPIRRYADWTDRREVVVVGIEHLSIGSSEPRRNRIWRAVLEDLDARGLRRHPRLAYIVATGDTGPFAWEPIRREPGRFAGVVLDGSLAFPDQHAFRHILIGVRGEPGDPATLHHDLERMRAAAEARGNPLRVSYPRPALERAQPEAERFALLDWMVTLAPLIHLHLTPEERAQHRIEARAHMAMLARVAPVPMAVRGRDHEVRDAALAAHLDDVLAVRDLGREGAELAARLGWTHVMAALQSPEQFRTDVERFLRCPPLADDPETARLREIWRDLALTSPREPLTVSTLFWVMEDELFAQLAPDQARPVQDRMQAHIENPALAARQTLQGWRSFLELSQDLTRAGLDRERLAGLLERFPSRFDRNSPTHGHSPTAAIARLRNRTEWLLNSPLTDPANVGAPP